MIRSRIRLAGVAGVAALSAFSLLAPLAAPVSAAPASPSTGCEISSFPLASGSQSNLNAACHFKSADAGSRQLIEDFPSAVWHNGAAREITLATVTVATKQITATDAHFTAADVNHMVSGTGIPAYTSIKSVTNATTAVLQSKTAFTTAITVGAKVKIENSSIRSIEDAVTTDASKTVTSATGNFKAEDVGRLISGTNIPDGTTIASVVSTSSVTLSANATAAGSAQVLAIGSNEIVTSARQIGDATFSLKNITSTSAKFAASDVGLPVTGGKAPVGAYIVSITSPTVAVMNANAASSGTTPVTIGLPSASAPKNGDAVAQLSSELILSPDLVKGQAPCSANQVYGTTIVGAWNNPGAYASNAALTGAAPTDWASIAQIQFPTAVISFFGYVEEVPAGSSDVQQLRHNDVFLPNIPTGLALCPGTDTTSAFRFFGSSLGTQAVATGTGRPSTTLRGIGRITGDSDQTATIRTAAMTTYNLVAGFKIPTGFGAYTNRSTTCTFKVNADFGYNCGKG
jgi:hypothetical protein